jgi:squalene-associated FAD-dependent desaturase
VKAVVVGGGLAGLAAALELVDGGWEVELYEARPTLGGAVQTLPEREGDPQPPPDNGQHIALGCFTAYLGFLERIGEAGSVLRTRLSLPVIGEDGSVAAISTDPLSFLRYRHLTFRERLRVVRQLLALRRAPLDDSRTFAELLGATARELDRFWDVFVRPALNLSAREASAAMGVFTVRTALLSERANADLVLPLKPLGWMHGDAAGRALEAAGATVRTDARVDSLDDLDADAIVVAVAPRESERLLGPRGTEPLSLDDSPIVSAHLLFDRKLLRHPLAALLGSDAHWVFDRGALTRLAGSEQASVRDSGPGEGVRGNREVPPWPAEAQYLTVVSSGVPELMELRGRELVDRLADQLRDRLGAAELLWSRVSREPYATVALRPGVARPGPHTDRANVVRAGAWTDTGWPATMESAIRSGHAAVAALTHDRERILR